MRDLFVVKDSGFYLRRSDLDEGKFIFSGLVLREAHRFLYRDRAADAAAQFPGAVVIRLKVKS